MTPIDSAKPVPPASKSSMAPPYVDEDTNEALVEQGLEAAEDEIRDAVADSYEEGARSSSDPQEMMDDIDYTEAEEDPISPEIAALHREQIPDDEP